MRLSTCRKDITPDRPCFQGGYAQRTEVYHNVHDPITVTAMCLEMNHKKIVIAGIDVAGFDEFVTDKIIDKVHSLGFLFECEKEENKPKEEVIEIIDKENNIKLTAEPSIIELFSTMYQNKSLIPNKMANKGIFTINDLLQLSTNIPNSRQERNIYNIKGLGESRVKELINYLHSLGFIFVDERTNLNNNMTLDYLFNTLDVEYVSREFYEKILTPDDFVDNKFVLIFIKQAEAVCTNEYDNKYTRKEIISFLNNKLLENKKKMLNITNSIVRQLKK